MYRAAVLSRSVFVEMFSHRSLDTGLYSHAQYRSTEDIALIQPVTLFEIALEGSFCSVWEVLYLKECVLDVVPG